MFLTPLSFWQAEHTLEQVLQQLVEHHIHRVYVVDDDRKPIGIVSLTDVLKLVVEV